MTLLKQLTLSRPARDLLKRLKRHLRHVVQTGDKQAAFDGRKVLCTLQPEDETQVVLAARLCASGEALLIPTGGAAPARVHLPRDRRPVVLLSTRRLKGVLDYKLAAQTITVRSGTTISELDAQVTAADWHLPVDVPFPDCATVGGAVAGNAHGPRTFKHGPIGDHIQNLHIVLANGDMVHSCDQVLPQLGYNLGNLAIGSAGSLGIVTAVQFRLTPLPDDFRMAMIVLQDGADEQRIMRTLMQAPMKPAVAELINAPAAQEFGHHLESRQLLLLVGYEGESRRVERQLQRLQSLFGDAVDLLDQGDSLEEYREIISWTEQHRDFEVDACPTHRGCSALLEHCTGRDIPAIAHAGTGRVLGHGHAVLNGELNDFVAELNERVAFTHCADGHGPDVGTGGDGLSCRQRRNLQGHKHHRLQQVKGRLDPAGIFPLPTAAP